MAKPPVIVAAMAEVYTRASSAGVTDTQPRCVACNRLLAHVLTRPWVIDCPRCKARNEHR